jgi:hypothetical protein
LLLVDPLAEPLLFVARLAPRRHVFRVVGLLLGALLLRHQVFELRPRVNHRRAGPTRQRQQRDDRDPDDELLNELADVAAVAPHRDDRRRHRHRDERDERREVDDRGVHDVASRGTKRVLTAPQCRATASVGPE